MPSRTAAVPSERPMDFMVASRTLSPRGAGALGADVRPDVRGVGILGTGAGAGDAGGSASRSRGRGFAGSAGSVCGIRDRPHGPGGGNAS
ncbi:MAG TPA: hypothetical protein VII10_09985, partial [Reyranella sp.]